MEDREKGRGWVMGEVGVMERQAGNQATGNRQQATGNRQRTVKALGGDMHCLCHWEVEGRRQKKMGEDNGYIVTWKELERRRTMDIVIWKGVERRRLGMEAGKVAGREPSLWKWCLHVRIFRGDTVDQGRQQDRGGGIEEHVRVGPFRSDIWTDEELSFDLGDSACCSIYYARDLDTLGQCLHDLCSGLGDGLMIEEVAAGMSVLCLWC